MDIGDNMIEMILGVLLARRFKGQSSIPLWLLICIVAAVAVIVIILVLQIKLGTWDPSSYYHQIPAGP